MSQIYNQVKRCSKCYVSNTMPNISFNNSGICNLCIEHEKEDHKESLESAFKDMISLFKNVKEKSKDISAYDCVVALSGGKDSSYILKYLVEKHGLGNLAITVDNGFLSRQSLENSKIICSILKSDFLVFKPNFEYMRKLYVNGLEKKNSSKAMIKRASDICSNCINLINNIMIKEALMRNINLIVGGYISGQVPKGSCIMKLHLNTLKCFAEIREKKRTTNKGYGPKSSDFSRFTNGQVINICNPFLAVKYNEGEILNSLGKINWKRPKDTGMHSSNCRINDLGILNHQKKYGFHPYELEISEQVRNGNLSYVEAKEKIDYSIDQQRTEQVKKELFKEK